MTKCYRSSKVLPKSGIFGTHAIWAIEDVVQNNQRICVQICLHSLISAHQDDFSETNSREPNTLM